MSSKNADRALILWLPVLLALGVVALASPSPALAQVDGPHFQLGAGYGPAWFEQWLEIEDHGAWSARLSYHPRATWGLEAQWDHVHSGPRGGSGTGSRIFNFIALGPRLELLPFETFSPYLSASVGYARFDLPEGTHGSLGAGLAGGVNGRVWSNFLLFAELRDDLASVYGSLTHQVLVSVGFRFSFGTSRDSDGDGLSDSLDHCPGTPPGAVVDEHGCPSDPDGDGVPNGLDDCPGTPTGTPVDEHGCPTQRERPRRES